MFARLESIAASSLRRGMGRCYRLVSALPFAGGRPWPNGRGSTSTRPPAASMAAAAEAEKAWA